MYVKILRNKFFLWTVNICKKLSQNSTNKKYPNRCFLKHSDLWFAYKCTILWKYIYK